MPVSIADAAAFLGFRSRSTLYRLLGRGLLKDWERQGPKGQRWLELEGLQVRVHQLVRLQITSPTRSARTKPAPKRDSPLPDSRLREQSDPFCLWEEVALVANGFLDVSLWGPPPWPADRWVTLLHVLEMAIDLVERRV